MAGGRRRLDPGRQRRVELDAVAHKADDFPVGSAQGLESAGEIADIADFFNKAISTVHFKKIILILSGYADNLYVPADAYIAEDHTSTDKKSSEPIPASDDAPLL